MAAKPSCRLKIAAPASCRRLFIQKNSAPCHGRPNNCLNLMESSCFLVFPPRLVGGDLHVPTAAKRNVSGHVIAPRRRVTYHFIQRSSARGVLLSSGEVSSSPQGVLRDKRAHADAALHASDRCHRFQSAGPPIPAKLLRWGFETGRKSRRKCQT